MQNFKNMKHEGQILKMISELGEPIQYSLPLGEEQIPLNEFIGKPISLAFSGKINCVLCGANIKKSYGTGFCYNCTKTAPQADPSVFQPELSKSQYGIYRDQEFAEKHDLIEHVVYLALSGNLKVGVTRINQIPTRWIDQGASSAIILAQTPNRHIAGIIECFLKQYFNDKTSWQAMLKNETKENIELLAEKHRAIKLLPGELQQYVSPNHDITKMHYPMTNYPKKINNLNFDKQAHIEGTLSGIKGQYLYLNHDTVLNIRRHEGYWISLES